MAFRLAIASLILAVISAIVGFSGLTVTYAHMGKIFFYMFLVLFVVLMVGRRFWKQNEQPGPPPP